METRPKDAIVVNPGEGKALHMLGTLLTVKIGSDSTGGAYALIEEIEPPRWSSPPHIHRHEDETFYILEGEYGITCP